MSSGHYQDHLEQSLTESDRKLTLAIKELEQCLIDLFEAEDKFHVLSFYIDDEHAHACSISRRDWMNRAGLRVEQSLKQIK